MALYIFWSPVFIKYDFFQIFSLSLWHIILFCGQCLLESRRYLTFMFHIKSHCQKKKSLSSPSSSKFSPISKFIWIFSYVYFCALNISGKFYETHKVCDQIYFFFDLYTNVPAPFNERLSFFHRFAFASFSKISLLHVCRSISGSLFCSIHLFMVCLFFFFPNSRLYTSL